MAQVKISSPDLDQVLKNFNEAPKKLIESLRKAMDDSTDLVKQRAKRKAGSPPIVFSGDLARSISAKASALKGTVSAEAKYSPFVEFGTRPHFPPVAPLERWAAIKLGKPGLGFVIARSISRKGTKAQPYMQPAVDESLNDIERIFGNYLDNVSVELVR